MKFCLLAIGFVLLLSIDEGECYRCRTVIGLRCPCYTCPFYYVLKVVCYRRRKNRSTEEVSSINSKIYIHAPCIFFTYSLCSFFICSMIFFLYFKKFERRQHLFYVSIRDCTVTFKYRYVTAPNI